MGAVLSSLRAHSSGVSPSSTEEGTQAQAPERIESATVVADVKKPTVPVIKESQPEEPESKDTSYGVEATAVRTLAASTGTVAILGTTAQTQMIPELIDDEDEIDEVFAEVVIVPGSDKAAKLREQQEGLYAKPLKLAQAPVPEPIFAKCPPVTKTPVPDEQEGGSDEQNKDASHEVTTLESAAELAQQDVEETQTNSDNETEPLGMTSQLEVKPVSSSEDSKTRPLNSALTVGEVPFQGPVICELIEKQEKVDPKNITAVHDSSPVSPVEEKVSPDQSASADVINIEQDIQEIQGHVSNDEDDISSEQLKTNSPSDLSISESLSANLDNTRKPDQTLAEIQHFLSVESSELSGILPIIESKDYDDESLASGDKETPGESSVSEKTDKIILSESQTASQVDLSVPLSFGNINEPGTPAMLPSPEEKETNNTTDIVTETQDEISDLEKDKSMIKDNSPESSNNLYSSNGDDPKTDSPELKAPSTESEPTDSIEKDTSDSKVSSSPHECQKEESSDSQEHLTDRALAELECMNSAAVIIQSSFRGYKVRRTLKTKDEEATDSDLYTLTPPRITDSMIDIVKEQLEGICKEAEEFVTIRSPILAGGDCPQDFPDPPPDMLGGRYKSDFSEIEWSYSSQLPAQLQDLSQTDTVTISEDDRLDTDNLPPPDFDVIGNIPDDSEDDRSQDTLTTDELLKLQQPQECAELPHELGMDTSPESSAEDHAAIKIQAAARGYLVRKKAEIKNDRKTEDKMEDLESVESESTEAGNPHSGTSNAIVQLSNEGAASEQSSMEQTFSDDTVIKKAAHDSTKQGSSDITDDKPTEEASSKQLSMSDQSYVDLVPIKSNANESSFEQKEQEPAVDAIAQGETVTFSISAPEEANREITEAVTTIQAGFRGYQTRKLLRENAVSKTISTDTQASGSVEEAASKETREESQESQAEQVIASPQEQGKSDEIIKQDESESATAIRKQDPETEENKAGLQEGEEEGDDLMHDSATKIQAGIRGFLVRQKQKVEREAAVKIQAGYRGFKTRQQMKENQPTQK